MQWHEGTIPEAITLAKEKQSVFLVFIYGDDEQSERMKKTFENSQVATSLNENCVSLKLDSKGESSMQFSQIYPVVVIPSTYFIGLSGVPIEVIGGFVDVETLTGKMNTVLEIHEKERSRNGPSSVASYSSSSVSGDSMKTKDDEESTDTQVSLEEKVQRAKELAALKREAKAKDEEEKEKQREMERRKMGKDVQKQRSMQQEREAKQVADEIARERAEEKAARERIREQIARDRAERAAKYNADKAEEEESRREATRVKQRVEQEKASAEAALRSQFARLQFRLPDGSSVTHQFDASAPLETVFNHVKDTIKPAFGSFVLCLSFPRREFNRSDYSQSLRDLQLTPSAAILILPSQRSIIRSSDSGAFSLFWLLLSPVLTLWRLLQSFLFGTGGGAPSTGGVGGSSNVTTSGASNTSRPQHRGGGGGGGGGRGDSNESGSSFGRRDGNVHRLADNSGDDDDDNNTWNGNSTQQM